MPSTDFSSDLITALASAGSDQGRDHLFRTEATLQNPQAVLALCEQASHWVPEDPALAQKAAEAALWLARSLNHLPSEGLAHRTLANVLTSLGKPSKALSEYKAALEVFASLNDKLQDAITRNSALTTVTDTLGPDSAFEWAAVAREAFQEKDDQLRLARLENNLAVLHFRRDEFTRALEHWKAANATLQRIGETSDQAATLSNLATCSISLNQPTEAKAYYKQARKLCVANNFAFRLHAIDYNIAYLHYLEGDHHRALQLYQAARNRSRELGDAYHETLCSLDETEVYIELNLLEEADTVAQLAATQFREQQRPYEAAKAMFNLALVRFLRGDPHAALSHLDSASEAFSGQGNILWPGQVELLRASIFSSEGRFFEAKRSSNLALSRFRQSGLLRRAALSELLTAKIDHSQGAIIEAEVRCRRALETLQSFGEPDSLFQAYFLLGKIRDTQGDSSGANEAFTRAEAHLMELRQRRTASQMRVLVADQPLEVYAHLVSLLLGDETVSDLSPEMFRLVETAKARSFADLMVLSGVPSRTPTKMRSQLVDQVSNLRQELNWLYRRIDRSELPDKATTRAAVESLQSQGQAKEKELAQTLSLLRVRSRDSETDPERIGIADMEAVQSLLRDSVLVEFHIAHDLVVALVLSEAHQKVLPVAVTSTVRDLQRKLWHYLYHAPTSTQGRVRSREPLDRILSELYTELLLPLEEFLGDSPLLIAPHGFLFLLPFHALRTEGEHLIERVPVSFLPSAASLSRMGAGNAVGMHRFGILDGSQALQRVEVFPEDSSLSFEVHQATGSSDSTLIHQALSENWSAVHLVGEGHLRSDNPLFSRVSLGSEDLTFLDLYRSQVLSPMISIEGPGFSPSTPSGDREVSALWGALLASGACCALVPAGFGPASAHREQARLLYKELFRGTEVAIAHRKAMLTMLRRGAATHEWASGFLVGDPYLSLNRRSDSDDPR